MKKNLFLCVVCITIVFFSYSSLVKKGQRIPLYSFDEPNVVLENNEWCAQGITTRFVVLGASKKGAKSLNTIFLKKFGEKKHKGVSLKEGVFTSFKITPSIVNGKMAPCSLFVCNAQVQGREVIFAFRSENFFDLDEWCVCDKKTTLGQAEAAEAVDYLEIFGD